MGPSGSLKRRLNGMRAITVRVIMAVGVMVVIAGCGTSSKNPPISGADIVAPAIAARYVVAIQSVTPAGDGYDWNLNALNGSEYTWKGTLTVKLLDSQKKILEQHDFPVPAMVAPGGTTSNLKFHSKLAPQDMGGTVTGIKVEVDVLGYEEPKK